MAKTVIVSNETVREMIEAYASMAAWFYQMSEAVRSAGLGVAPPSDEQRRAYVAQAAGIFPEVAHVATSITAPRPYLPPPALRAATSVTENESVEIKPPPAELADVADPRPAPPLWVEPNKVRY